MPLAGSIVKRVVVGGALLVAFVFMASVFAPDRSKATAPPIIDPIAAPRHSAAANSTNPHQGLRSLGTFESADYTIHVYCTDLGPRYTICAARDHRQLGVLMSATDIARHFPAIQLPDIRFDAPMRGESGGIGLEQVMTADTDKNAIHR